MRKETGTKAASYSELRPRAQGNIGVENWHVSEVQGKVLSNYLSPSNK